MIVYEVFDADVHGDVGCHYRNLKEARQAWAEVATGRLTKVTIQTPITKDVVIGLLNDEGYAVEQVELEVR